MEEKLGYLYSYTNNINFKEYLSETKVSDIKNMFKMLLRKTQMVLGHI
jgi:hypothetical protein